MKHVITILLIVFTTATGQAQAQKSLRGSSLWLVTKDSIPTVKKDGEILYDLNFNPIISFSKDKLPKQFKNMVGKQFSVFAVFRSSEESDEGLFSFKKSNVEIRFSNKKIEKDSVASFNKGNPKTGILVSYLNTINSALSRKKGNLIFDNILYHDTERRNELFELIYIPKYLTEIDKNIVESYLSIKYGISLEGNKDYYDSMGNKIWDHKENDTYKNRITGLGRDDLHQLYQKQSGNSAGGGMFIGLEKIAKTNIENKSKIPNGTYLMWGDNGLELLFESDGYKYHTMKRTWKVNGRSDADKLKTQIFVDKKLMMFPKPKVLPAQEEVTWLAIDSLSSNNVNHISSKFVRPSFETQDTLIFNDVKLRGLGSQLFTFVRAPEFFALHNATQANCAIGLPNQVDVKIVGGVGPFTLKLRSETFSKDFVSSDDHIAVKDLPPGNYTSDVFDNNGHFSQDKFQIGSSSETAFTMSSIYVIGNSPIIIKPVLKAEGEFFKFEWSAGDSVISAKNEILVDSPGKYNVTITDAMGCSTNFPFTVTNTPDILPQEWTVFPNPTTALEEFTIKFNFTEPFDVTMTLADLNGKVITRRILGNVTQLEINEILKTAGTYLVTVTKDGVAETRKLIIK